ncbi:MAG TPA: metalloregulator ArsR/SmtB family transcription factor [Streptosporangiaceae bacterium]|nr:metalloregulator ArsR/SmtB family transcription factor [Streptosporangiaceae bacterium]
MSNQVVLPVLGQGQRACCAPLTRAPLGEGEAAEVAQVLKALADPVRLRLLSLIGAHDGGEACVCDLTVAFDLTGPTISHHLKVLREAGLIQSERRGTWVYYRIVPPALASLAGLFTPDLAPAGTR